MTWFICLSCTASWIALVVTLCLFFRMARGDDFGEGQGFANDNGIIMRFPVREPLAPFST